MSTTWTFAQLVDALKTQVEGLATITALDPVPAVRVSAPHPSEDISDVIIFGIDAEGSKEQIAMGAHSHDEEVTVGCLVETVRYGSGNDEAKTARDRALTIVAIVDNELRTNAPEVGTQTHWARVTDYVFDSFPTDISEGVPARVARVAFNIEYKARTNP